MDDQSAFLALARVLLREDAGIAVVGEATSGEEALTLTAALAPDVVVLDIELPEMHGFATARRLLQTAPELRVVMVSASDDAQYATLARAVGARGFLAKKAFSADALTQILAE